MSRWDKTFNTVTETPKVDAFISDILEVYKKHNMSISHEDNHGAFIIEELTEENIEWITVAHCR